MREKIARAICEELGRDPDQLEPGNAHGVDEEFNSEPHFCLWRMYGEAADAVLAAMREPTEAMKASGQKLHWGSGNSACESSEDEEAEHCGRIFTAMIDAAKEGE